MKDYQEIDGVKYKKNYDCGDGCKGCIFSIGEDKEDYPCDKDNKIHCYRGKHFIFELVEYPK